MTHTLIAVALCMATGLAAAGACASLYGLVAQRLGPGGGETADRVARMALLVVAGPLLILSAAWSTVRDGTRPPRWLALTGAIAAAWSFCLGLALLNLLVAAG